MTDAGRRETRRGGAWEVAWRVAVFLVALALPLGIRQIVVSAESEEVEGLFTYSVSTRGAVKANLADFERLAAAGYADPRGWQAAGFQFRRVDRGGDFALYLATADSMRSFGASCSPDWSCRVGNHVVINEERWLRASPAWNEAGLPLRDYRFMVLNHETGHWLGHGHAGCGGAGQRAPVMMQQSKELGRCRPNPFPLPAERWSNRVADRATGGNG